MALSPLQKPYSCVKEAASSGLYSDSKVSERILDLILTSVRYLNSDCVIVDVESLVTGKQYSSYATKAKRDAISRPVNRKLFMPDEAVLKKDWREWTSGEPDSASASLIYTMATAYGVASDLFDRGNKKAPATYFEILVAHLFARTFGVNPSKKARIPVAGTQVALTMDFIFEPDKQAAKIHLPVKMSSRERVVQAWAHQRLLDEAYGVGKYKGVLVVHSETKLDLTKREVVEICVPDQWLAYQTYLGRMDRIYYFDIPKRYAKMAEEHPALFVLKHISDFFDEKDALISPRT